MLKIIKMISFIVSLPMVYNTTEIDYFMKKEITEATYEEMIKSQKNEEEKEFPMELISSAEGVGLSHQFILYIRKKFISADSRKQELTEMISLLEVLIENPQLLNIKNLATNQNSTWEVLNNWYKTIIKENEEDDEYEIIDKEVVRYEQKMEEWKNLLEKLKIKLQNIK